MIMTSNLKHKALWFALLAATCGCSENPTEESDSSLIVVTASVSRTRTQYANSGTVKKTEWLRSDGIGICAGTQQNLRYEASETGSSVRLDAIDEPLSAACSSVVFAYYPYQTEQPCSANVVPLPDLAQQIYDPANPGACDFLYGSGLPENGRVALQFHHAFSVVEIPLPLLTAIGFDETGIEKIVLRRANGGPLWTSGTLFDLVSQRLIVPDDGTPSSEITLDTSLLKASDHPAESLYITVPSFVAEEKERIVISAWIDGREYPIVEKQAPDEETGFRKGTLYLLDNGSAAVISLAAEGTLGELVTQEQLQSFTSIKIVGPMNDADATLFGSGKNADRNGYMEWLVETLDLSEATFQNDALSYGFNSLPHLRELRLSPTLKKIYRFDNCVSLAKIDFGAEPALQVLGNGSYIDNNTLNNTTVYCGAFSRCTALHELRIPASVTAIGAFYHSGLRNLIFAENSSITSFDPSSASADTGMGTDVQFNIGMFFGCTELETIEIPRSVIKISADAFKGSYLKTILFNGRVPEIDKGAFAGCNHLTAFIGENASADHRCLIVGDTLTHFLPPSLTSYCIPDNVKVRFQGIQQLSESFGDRHPRRGRRTRKRSIRKLFPPADHRHS